MPLYLEYLLLSKINVNRSSSHACNSIHGKLVKKLSQKILRLMMLPQTTATKMVPITKIDSRVSSIQ